MLFVYSYVMSQQYLYAQHSNGLLQLQQDVNQLQSLFIRWKQCLLHLPSVNESQKIEIGQQIVMKLNCIFQTVGQFCFKFQQQMFSLQNKLQSIILKANTSFQTVNKFQHSQFGLVMRKVQTLEKQLRQTTQRSNKLQEALSVIISKPILQQNSKHQLKHIKSSHQLNMAYGYGEQSFIYNLPLQCSSKSSRTKCGVQKRQNQRLNQSKIYVSSVQSNNFEQQLKSNPFLTQRVNKSQFIRTLSLQNQHKYSLKQMPIISKQQNCNTPIDRSESLVFTKHTSRVKHDHRLNFMMKNLQQ